MTNNTIPNVPRELLATALKADASIGASAIDLVAGWKAMAELRALLSAPSPAGVDGLEVEAWLCEWMADKRGGVYSGLSKTSLEGLRRSQGEYALIVSDEPLCRLSAAQAIIDGLRGEVGAQRVKTCAALKARNDAREERDQLAGLLREAHDTYRAAIHWEDLRGTMKRIDAALSASKEGE